MQATLCSLCGFIIFGTRTVFSMDACCLFPQHVLAITPLMGVQMQWLVSTPGFLAAAAVCDHPWSPKGQLMSLLVPRRATAAVLSFDQREL